jgi:hypothetical protein
VWNSETWKVGIGEERIAGRDVVLKHGDARMVDLAALDNADNMATPNMLPVRVRGN